MADPGSLCSGRQVLLAWLSCGQPFSPGASYCGGKKGKKNWPPRRVGGWMKEKSGGRGRKRGRRVENERRDKHFRLKIKETKSEPECLRMALSRNNCKKKKGKIIWGSNDVVTMMFDLQMEGGKKTTTLLNHLSPETFTRRGFGKPATPTDNQVVALIMGAHDIIPRWKQTHTYPHTGSASHADSGPATLDELSTHAQHITTQTTRTHTHSHSSEIWGLFWQPPSWLGVGQTGAFQEKQSGPARGLGLLCLWSVTLHHEGNP